MNKYCISANLQGSEWGGVHYYLSVYYKALPGLCRFTLISILGKRCRQDKVNNRELMDFMIPFLAMIIELILTEIMVYFDGQA